MFQVGDRLTRDVEVSELRRWGGQKKKKMIPAFLLTREEREKLLYRKNHSTGRPKKGTRASL